MKHSSKNNENEFLSSLIRLYMRDEKIGTPKMTHTSRSKPVGINNVENGIKNITKFVVKLQIMFQNEQFTMFGTTIFLIPFSTLGIHPFNRIKATNEPKL